MVPEKLGWMINLVPEITSEEIGFEITAEMRAIKHHDDPDESDTVGENKKRMPPTKFEAVPDDLTPEEILAKSQIAARHAKAKLSKYHNTKNRYSMISRNIGEIYFLALSIVEFFI